MANPEHLEVLKRSTPHWNRWRSENPSIVPNISGGPLRTVRLSNANLAGVHAEFTYFGEADLSGAILNGADLSQAYLRGAQLACASLERARLCETELSEADLTKARLAGAALRGARLRRA